MPDDRLAKKSAVDQSPKMHHNCIRHERSAKPPIISEAFCLGICRGLVHGRPICKAIFLNLSPNSESIGGSRQSFSLVHHLAPPGWVRSVGSLQPRETERETERETDERETDRTVLARLGP